MQRILKNLITAAVIAAGIAATGAATTAPSSLRLEVDPWDNARYLIGIKSSAEALKIIDSGQFDINMENEEGYTLLHFAAEAGDLSLVKAMLDRGANPNANNNSVKYTPYQMAYSSMVKAELRKAMTGARVSPQTASPQAPGAVAPQRFEQAKAPALTRGTSARTGLCEIARNDPASSSRSPSMRPFLAAKDAIWYNHPDELTGLLEDCVSVNQQDEYGWSLLHQAAQRDRVALTKILLEHGASKLLRNKDGQTAADLATSPEMRALLGAPSSDPAPRPASGRDVECQQKYQADVRLCSDSTCRMRSNRKWQQCLATGNYW